MEMVRDGFTVIDEWTSVVDRTVAKVMSHCVQKFARKNSKQIVLVSCHYDVIEWLNPDWVIDCNRGTYEDRRLLWRNAKREEQLQFEVKQVDRSTWKYFSKYHYLSDKLAGGRCDMFGLFHGGNQVGFIAYSNYVPRRPGEPLIMHFNRLVVHPDFAGLGLGRHLVNATAKLMVSKGYRVMGKFSSTSVFRALQSDRNWKLKEVKRQIGKMAVGENMQRQSGFRENIKTYSFEFVGNAAAR